MFLVPDRQECSRFVVPRGGGLEKPLGGPFPEGLKHCIPQHGVDLCLVAAPLGTQPGDHIGVEAHGDLFLYRPIERIADRLLKKGLVQFRKSGDSQKRPFTFACFRGDIIAGFSAPVFVHVFRHEACRREAFSTGSPSPGAGARSRN